MKQTFKHTVLAFSIGLMGFTTHALADGMPLGVPSSDSLLQQQRQMQPTLKPQEAVQFQDSIPSRIDSNDKTQVWIKQIVFEGNKHIATDQLQTHVADVLNQRFTFNQLQDLVHRITAYYGEQGYPYSRAYLPPQNMSSGKLIIRIIEAKHGEVVVDNQTRIQDGLLNATLAPLQKGTVIETAKLERQLKLIDRLGAVTRNTISAGAEVGTSDLNVEIYPATPLVTGYVGMDNYGNKYTKEFRVNAGATLHNPFGLGDRLSVDGTTTGKHYNYGKVAYELGLNGHGTRLGTSYSRLDYKLGKELSVLDAKGSADQMNVWLSHPLVYTNQTEVIATVSYDHKRLKDKVNVIGSLRDRNVDTGRLYLDAFHFDGVGGGGLNQFGVGAHLGRVNFKNDAARDLDALTTQHQGAFKLFTANASRLQNLGKQGTQLYVGIQGQYSPDNLEADRFNAGGPFAVSGYQNQILGGSSGYYAVAELRQSLLQTHQNNLVGKLFVDTAEAKFVANKWPGYQGTNRARINSAGVALNWDNAKKWQVQARIGVPFGKQPETLEKRHDVEAWVSVNKLF